VPGSKQKQRREPASADSVLEFSACAGAVPAPFGEGRCTPAGPLSPTHQLGRLFLGPGRTGVRTSHWPLVAALAARRGPALLSPCAALHCAAVLHNQTSTHHEQPSAPSPDGSARDRPTPGLEHAVAPIVNTWCRRRPSRSRPVSVSLLFSHDDTSDLPRPSSLPAFCPRSARPPLRLCLAAHPLPRAHPLPLALNRDPVSCFM
jgi:hypothetical protein